MGNKIKKKVIDSGREYLQILSLCICFVFPRLVNLSEIIRVLLGGQEPNIDTAKFYFLMLSGNYVIGLLLVLYVLFNFIRKANKDTILNKGNIYHNHFYTWYWFCSKILGYDKCNLILVPIHMQFKLVLNDTFKEYPFDNELFPEEDSEIQVIKKDENHALNIFNIVIEDTYSIVDNQIPESYLNYQTIKIIRSSTFIGKRVYSHNLVDVVVEEMRLLPEGSTINIFATTNPKNTYEIARKGLRLAERSNIFKVNVFDQEKDGERNFKEKINTVISR